MKVSKDFNIAPPNDVSEIKLSSDVESFFISQGTDTVMIPRCSRHRFQKILREFVSQELK